MGTQQRPTGPTYRGGNEHLEPVEVQRPPVRSELGPFAGQWVTLILVNPSRKLTSTRRIQIGINPGAVIVHRVPFGVLQDQDRDRLERNGTLFAYS